MLKCRDEGISRRSRQCIELARQQISSNDITLENPDFALVSAPLGQSHRLASRLLEELQGTALSLIAPRAGMETDSAIERHAVPLRQLDKEIVHHVCQMRLLAGLWTGAR